MPSAVNQSLSLHNDLGDLTRAEANAIIDRNGMFLGASRDFWILLVTCVSALAVCFLMTFGTVELNTRRRRKADPESDEEMVEPLTKPSPDVGFAQKTLFKGSRYGTSFAFHADLALRGALVALFCAATYCFEFLDWWRHQGWSMGYVVVILAFTLYLDLGSTVNSAWTGFYGTLLPVLNCWLMFYLYPNGVKHDDMSSKVFGWVDFFVFVLLTFALGFATNAKMYALSWQAYFSMCFLNPFDTTIFSRGAADVQLQAAETGALMGTIIGCVFAIFVAILPRNISALNKAQDLMIDLAWSHGRLLEQLLEMGCFRMQPQAASVFAVEVQNLQQQLEEIRSLLSISWWECFDLGAAGQSRLMLLEICRSVDFLNDWLEAMVMAVQHAKGNKDPELAHIMDAAQKELLQLIYSTKGSLQRSASAAAQGDLNSETEERLEFCISELEDGQVKLHEVFKSRLKQDGSWQRFFTSSHLPQFALASSASGYTQKVADLLESMAEFDPSDHAVGPCRGFLKGVIALPGKDLVSWDANLNILKLMATFTLCFILGRLGVGSQQKFVPAFNATPAGTVAYLIFQGGDQAAALKKNMDRFMGVAFGSMLGTLTVGTCGSLVGYFGWYGSSVLFLVVYFAFELLSLYVYFASPTYFYVGLMFSCFFATSALRPIDDLMALGKSDYQNILSQLMAILIATLMDILADKSLSIRATANLEKFILIADEAFDSYPLSTRSETLELRKEGLAHLHAASADGAEAAREPRCLGVPWREDLWNRVLKVCSETWQCLTIVSTTSNPTTDQEKSLRASVEVLFRSPTFKQELRHLRHRQAKTFQLAMYFMKQNYYDERSTEMMELQEALVSSKLLSAEAAMPQIMKELQAGLQLEEKAHRLLDNQICAVAMFLMMFEALVEREAQLEAAILQQPEVWQLLAQEDLEDQDSTFSAE